MLMLWKSTCKTLIATEFINPKMLYEKITSPRSIVTDRIKVTTECGRKYEVWDRLWLAVWSLRWTATEVMNQSFRYTVTENIKPEVCCDRSYQLWDRLWQKISSLRSIVTEVINMHCDRKCQAWDILLQKLSTLIYTVTENIKPEIYCDRSYQL